MWSALNAIVNGAWFLGCAGEALLYRFQRDRTAQAQARVLRDIVRANRCCEFGRQHGFSDIRSVAEFRDRVPLSTWDEYAEAVQRIAAGERRVLTAEKVLRFLPTGGSVSGSKLVPYTRELQREFSRGIDPWVFHLFRWRPGLLMGCAYFSITPFGSAARRTPSGIPVGFDDDSAYLGSIMRRIGDRFLAVPRAVALICDPDAYRYVSLLFLLRRRDLALASVWNPAVLAIMLEKLSEWSEQLVTDIETGRIAEGVKLEPAVRRACQERLRPNGRRAAELRPIFDAWQGRDPRNHDSRGRTLYEALWPRLRVISCWADANAEGPARRLKDLFPHVDLQPKGLLSTEGFISFPVGGMGAGALATRSHFFEFIDESGGARTGGSVRLAHELARGCRYEVVITTGGGLYRYRTRDIVEVTGAWGGSPTIRLVGRADMVSDLFGEKLSEAHVRTVVEASLAKNGIRPDFWMVAPERGESACGFYALFIQLSSGRHCSGETGALGRAAEEIETGLRSNPQYLHCVRLGQLHPLRVFRIAERAAEDYLSICAAQGQRLGDIKPPALHRRTGWSAVFRGELLP